jgi:hypothetical protein
MVEDKNDSSTLSYADIDDNNYDDSINPVEKTAKKVVTEIKEALSSGAKGIEKKVVPMQDVIKEGGGQNDIEKVVKGVVNEAKEIIHEGARSAEQKIKEGQDLIEAKQPKAEEHLAEENISKIENLAKQPDSDGDLASFEGRYPKDLFNKSVFSNDKQTLIGHVTKETDSLIVVFSDSDNSRFDIPKSKITVDGGSVVLIENDAHLLQYKVERGVPFPQDNKSLRPTAKEIFHTTREIEEEGEEKQAKGEVNIQTTRADALIKEGQELANSPRPSTIRVSKPENYHNDKEAEIIKKVKRAASDLKDIILSAATITERRVKEFREAEEERQVEIDAENISKMGSLATQFTNSFEDVLTEIRTRTYAEQEQIYIGFLKLIEQQRELIVARKDLSARLKASVRKPVVVVTGSEEDRDKLPKNIEVPQIQGQQQPQLPEEMDSQEQSKQAEPFIMTDEPTEQAAVIQKSSQPLESSTEIPAAEIQANITTGDENEESKKKFQSSKKSKYNKKNVKTRTSD